MGSSDQRSTGTPRLLRAALDAARVGLHVFPVQPRGKSPAVEDWENAATTEPGQIAEWWSARPYNLGLACGPSGLVVVDLDDGRGDPPPEAWVGARNGFDVLVRLAAAAGQPVPTDTYTVATPGGAGRHLYFRAPADLELRNTASRIGWRIDTRAAGGYVVGAGSVRADGLYRVARRGRVQPLPGWLTKALTPPPAAQVGEPLVLPRARASAYVAAIVERETSDVAAAATGTRHHTLLRAARTLGRLVGGGELDEDDARAALHAAAARHIGVGGTTAREVEQTIDDGVNYGKQAPRRIQPGLAWPRSQLGDLSEGSR